MYSRSIEDYIKAIYELGGNGRVSSSALAAKLGVTPASVTGMLKKIAPATPHVIDYVSHKGARLTSEGEAVALGILRRHRLVELFLTNVLGYSWDEVHEEAEKLEHVVSPKLEERLARLLGHPAVDPHGDPIPTSEGTIDPAPSRALSSLEAGERGRVRRVVSRDEKLLQYLGGLGIVLGARLAVTEKAPFAGPIHLRVGVGPSPGDQVIGRSVADQIFMELERRAQ